MHFKFISYYILIFVPVGAAISFFPTWVREFDLTLIDIGSIIATGYTSKIIINPLCIYIAKHFNLRKFMLIGLSFLALISSSLFLFVTDRQLVSGAYLLWLVFGSPLDSLGESLVIANIQQTGTSYASKRLWGSVSVVITAMFMGISLQFEYRVLAVSVIPLAYLGLFILFLSFDDIDDQNIKDTGKTDNGESNVSKKTKVGFGYLILSAAPVQAIHGLYYAYSIIYFRQIGFSFTAIGFFWVIAVLSEIVVYTYFRKLFESCLPFYIIAISALAGIVRWGILGSTDTFYLIFIAQLLQGLTLAALALGVAQYFVKDTVPEKTSLLIGWYNALAYGVFQGICVYLGGGDFRYLFWP